MELIEYPDAEMMMIDLADQIASQLRSRLSREDLVTLAVPGGSTPGPIFDSLCGIQLDWPRVRVMLTDERWVPETHERSNTRLLRQRLLTDRAAAARYIPLYADAPEPEERLDELSRAVSAALPISVLLLGMGTDMHTASIFPEADRLKEALTTDAPLVAMRAPGAPEPRITLSARVLKSAMSRHIVITGTAKREALERAQSMVPERAPVAAVLKDSTVHWAES